MQVEYLVRIGSPDEDWGLNMLEPACWKAVREAGQGLFLMTMQQRDREAVDLADSETKSKVRRYLTTILSVITCNHEKVS